MTRRRLVTVFGVGPSPRRLPVALKAAVTIALPPAVALLAGRPDLGLIFAPGAFTVLYGPTAPARFRLKLMGLAGLGLVAAASLGTWTAGYPALGLAAMVAAAIVATFVCAALKVGPPGPYFFPLVVGIAGYQAGQGVPGALIIIGVALGAALAVGVGMSDLLFKPRGAEQAAMARAESAIRSYELDAGQRRRASAALHAAWTALNDGAGRRRLSLPRQALAAQLVGLHQRYVTRTGELAGASLALAPKADPDRVVPDRIDLEKLRDTSLGRPHARHLLASALSWPSESTFTALRVGVAASLAGLAASVLGIGHEYWAVAFAVLVLANVGSRHTQLLKAVHRFIGTSIGLVLFFALMLLNPQGWWLVLLLAGLQFGIEMLVVRQYAYAAALITPLALTLSTSASPNADPSVFLVDRGIDTLIGLGAAVLVVMALGRRVPTRLVRAAGRRTLQLVQLVVRDLAAGSWASVAAREHRRHLYYELLEGEEVLGRAHRDAPAAVEAQEPAWRAINELGYLVLGACWHPSLRDDAERYAAAERLLTELVANPDDLTVLADISQVRALFGEGKGAE